MKRRRKWVLVVLLVVAVGVAALEVLWHRAARLAVERHLASIRAQGLPATPEELDAWYAEPPPGENAAEIYEEAFKRFAAVRGDMSELDTVPVVGNAELPEPHQPFPPDMLEATEKAVELRHEALELLHRGAQRPKARYSVDLSRGVDTQYHHLGGVKNGVGLLMLEAVVRAERGDGEGAADSLWAALRLSDSLVEEPALFSQLTRIRAHEQVVRGLAQALNRQALAEPGLARLAEAFAVSESRDTLYRGLAGERACELTYFTTRGTTMGWDVWPYVWKAIPPLRVADFERYANRMDAVVRAAQGSSSERRQLLMTEDSYYLSTPMYCIVTRYIGGDAQNFARGFDDRAQLRLACGALALERYRLAHGELPMSLRDLAPDLLDGEPLDPYADPPRPLQYLAQGEGYLLYSVGPDGMDAGGVRLPGQADDVAIRVSR